VTNLGFIIAGYGVILGGLAIYAVTLVRRLRNARAESLRIRHHAEAGPDIGGDRRP
jgi:hypothetical protein